MLKAEADSGPVAGQVAVMATGHIRGVSLVPSDPVAPHEAVDVLADADQIVLGPGSLFTSVLAAIAVPEIRDGIERSGATKVYVCNLRPQVPETEDFDVAMHVEALASTGSRSTWSWPTRPGSHSGGRHTCGRCPAGTAQRDGPRCGKTGRRTLGPAQMTALYDGIDLPW